MKTLDVFEIKKLREIKRDANRLFKRTNKLDDEVNKCLNFVNEIGVMAAKLSDKLDDLLK